MNDTRASNGQGAAGATSTGAKFKTAAPVAAGALAVVAAIVGATMWGADSSEEIAAIEPAVVAAPETPSTTSAPEPGTSMPGVAFDQAQTGGRPAMGVEIVVKFKDDAKVKDIIDAFWKDQASAQAKFEVFKRGKPAFAGLKLGRVTYSNELVLIDETGQINDARSTAMRAIAARLKDNPDISYADPNMTAQPGAQ